MLGPELISEATAACQANGGEIAQALTRALDATLEVAVGGSGAFDAGADLATFDETGLLVLLKFETSAIALVVAESSGLLPAWYAEPDPTGQSKLNTLGQELSMLVVPDRLMADDFKVARVANLKRALTAGELAASASRLELEIKASDGRSGKLTALWPLAAPDHVFQPAAEPVKPAVKPTPVPAAAMPHPTGPIENDELPNYTRSLLRIRLPISVTLAEKRQPVKSIVELGIGSIIHFSKPCDDPLDLEVNGRKIAQGEAVKVGDKFGLRVRNISLPEERFRRLG